MEELSFFGVVFVALNDVRIAEIVNDFVPCTVSVAEAVVVVAEMDRAVLVVTCTTDDGVLC